MPKLRQIEVQTVWKQLEAIKGVLLHKNDDAVDSVDSLNRSKSFKNRTTTGMHQYQSISASSPLGQAPMYGDGRSSNSLSEDIRRRVQVHYEYGAGRDVETP
jgi:hypothetical protein